MRRIELGQSTDLSAVVALGFFDCIHAGHRTILAETRALAAESDAEPALFTFSDDPFRILGKPTKLIYGFEERLRVLEGTGIRNVLYAKFDRALMEESPDDFLDRLFRTVAVRGFVCGTDYTYGAKSSGNIHTLSEVCRRRNVPIRVVPDVTTSNGAKISSSRIRSLISEGNLREANRLLTVPFRLRGTVGHGRGVGKKYRTPTANFDCPTDTVLPRTGVYATVTTVDGVRYRSVTNVGAKPTFGDDTESIETFLIDFDGDLYTKTLQIEFLFRLRDIRKFESKEALYRQIEIDKEWKA